MLVAWISIQRNESTEYEKKYLNKEMEKFFTQNIEYLQTNNE
jgi:hypothetical protein